MITEKTKVDYNPYFTLVQNDILDVLVYFTTFQHPLNIEEIQNNCVNKYSTEKVQNALTKLIEKELVFEYNSYYTLSSLVSEWVINRIEKEYWANQLLNQSDFYIKIIKSMPFVRAVAISGSVSKGVAHDKGDLDYFIITEKNRLWLSRTLLILFKKLFLLNSRRYFCVNYFLDMENLQVPDKNIFTATEIAYLIPVYNKQLIEEFQTKNNWFKAYYPDFDHPIKRKIHSSSRMLKKALELPFYGKLGHLLDTLFMKLTIKRWDRKFADFDREKFELTMRSQKGVSKHHPRDFQNRVLDKISEIKGNLYPGLKTKL